MKNYEKPIVTLNEEIAEGVYAASGDCWSISWVETQDWNGNYKVYELIISHSAAVEHVSSASTVKLSFNNTITEASGESNDYSCSCSGMDVYLTRMLTGNAYVSGDQVTYKLFVKSIDEATTKALAIENASISCTKVINVQGGGADEL